MFLLLHSLTRYPTYYGSSRHPRHGHRYYLLFRLLSPPPPRRQFINNQIYLHIPAKSSCADTSTHNLPFVACMTCSLCVSMSTSIPSCALWYTHNTYTLASQPVSNGKSKIPCHAIIATAPSWLDGWCVVIIIMNAPQ